MQARYYDPALGRFLSIDPVEFKPELPQQFNRYAYAWNDPVNANDPDGRFLNFVVKFAVDVAIEAAVQYATTGQVNVGEAVVGAAAGLVNPGRTVDRAATLARVATAGAERTATAARAVCCFVAGTLVDTADGLRPIEAIKVGDLVWARNPETGETALKPVTDVIPRHERQIWTVTLSGPEGATATFETTDEHPWWVAGVGWVRTDALAPGMAVVTRDGRGMVLTQVTRTDRFDGTYNLTVADFETYFVGEQRVFVHNCGVRPPNLAPPGAGRSGALNQAKRDNDIPTSQQPDRTGPNVDRQGAAQPGRQYTYTNNSGQSVTIRDDAAGHQYSDDPSQNRGTHFNDEAGRHYDYKEPG